MKKKSQNEENRKWSISFKYTEFHYFFNKKSKLHNKTFNKKNNELCTITEKFLNDFCGRINLWNCSNFPKMAHTHKATSKKDINSILENLKKYYSNSYEKIIEIDEDQKFEFVSQNIDAKKRIIFWVDQKNKILFPIIFDINHLLISTKNNEKFKKKHNEAFEWNLDYKRKNILKILEEKIKINLDK